LVPRAVVIIDNECNEDDEGARHWNTHHTQKTLDRWRVQNREIDPEILHHITSVG
jgi:hypothetical protein